MSKKACVAVEGVKSTSRDVIGRNHPNMADVVVMMEVGVQKATSAGTTISP